jgi:protein-S-isoprenylcysteine O-methyltransferase Ste14
MSARTIGSAAFVVFWPALLLVLGGDAGWRQAWIFAAWLVGLYIVITLWMHMKDPALLAERRRPSTGGNGQSGTDRGLVLAIFAGFAVWIVLMPLDARRFGWSPSLPSAVQWLGGGLLALSAWLLFRAVYDNTFLSGVVRVQDNRGQQVVSTGAYGVVRHPMYLGMALMFVGAPLLLGSLAGLVIAALLVAVLCARIVGEERVLVDGLEGYAEYQKTVRYRLVPFVW